MYNCMYTTARLLPAAAAGLGRSSEPVAIYVVSCDGWPVVEGSLALFVTCNSL